MLCRTLKWNFTIPIVCVDRHTFALCWPVCRYYLAPSIVQTLKVWSSRISYLPCMLLPTEHRDIRDAPKGRPRGRWKCPFAYSHPPAKKVSYFKCLFTPCIHCSIIMLPAFFLQFLHNENSFKGLLLHECVKLLTLNCGWCENPQKKKGDDFSATP